MPTLCAYAYLHTSACSDMVPAYARARRCPASWYRLPYLPTRGLGDVRLRASYAMSGTDIAYDATRTDQSLYPSGSTPLSDYATPMSGTEL
eukprot:3375935-Rhodomonas_salina.2